MDPTYKYNNQNTQELEELSRIKWMLSKEPGDMDREFDNEYGDITELNKKGLILNSLGKELLKDITSEYLNLLETSTAVYEANGDYAFGIISSGWCRMLDKASRDLCNTGDNQEALNSGLWLCHESCRANCSKKAIEEQTAVDIECHGGIRLYAIPVFAENRVIGAINFGYGDPPKDPGVLKEIAEKYKVDYDHLKKEAKSYLSRPKFMVEMAKDRLQNSARIIGSLIENKLAQKREEHLKNVLRGIRNVNQLIIQEKDTAKLIQKACIHLAGSMGFERAWIILLNKSEGVVDSAYSETRSNKFAALIEQLNHGIYPECIRKALKQDKVIVNSCNTAKCKECMLSEESEGLAYLCTSISYDQNIYGVLAVFTPEQYAESKEEQELFREVANDIGFAIYKNELEEKNRQAEKKVLWWKDLMEYIIHHNPNSVAIFNEDLHYIWVSRKYLDDYNILDKDIIGKYHYDVFPGMPEKWKKVHQRALNGEVLCSDEDTFPRSDGTVDYIRWECRPWHESAATVGGIVLYTEVITERKKVEDALKERIKEIRCLYEISDLSNMPGIELKEFFKKIVNIIPGSMQYPELAGAKISIEGKAYKSHDFQNAKWKIKQDIEVKRSVVGTIEVCYLDNNNTKTDPYLPDEKRMINTISKELANFYERKQTEQNLVETNENLQEMIYIASHDLQVPLVSMQGFANELLENYRENLDEEGVYCLTRLQNNSQRMHKLVRSLLDISRLNTTKISYKEFDLNKVVEKIINDLSLSIENAGANFIIGELPHLYADSQRIESTLRNILTNALIYEGKKIEIYYKDSILSIKDDGAGIPPDQLERIFRPGERIKSVKTEGIGMGLTFCRKVVKQHKGKIWAESGGVNKGTTICIKFHAGNIVKI